MRSIFKERKLRREFHAHIQDLMGQITFKKRKLKGEFPAVIQDLMGQIYFSGEKIERRISCSYSGLDVSDVFLK